jgi:hypothetical protein
VSNVKKVWGAPIEEKKSEEPVAKHVEQHYAGSSNLNFS